MKSRDFCYWLQGFFELCDQGKGLNAGMSASQVEIVRNHLNMVFIHEIDPSFPAVQQTKLDDAHMGKPTALRC